MWRSFCTTPARDFLLWRQTSLVSLRTCQISVVFFFKHCSTQKLKSVRHNFKSSLAKKQKRNKKSWIAHSRLCSPNAEAMFLSTLSSPSLLTNICLPAKARGYPDVSVFFWSGFTREKRFSLLVSRKIKIITLRPNPHRTRDATHNAMQANGTCWCEWGCLHCTQATLKEKFSNLWAHRVLHPVWIGPEP